MYRARLTGAAWAPLLPFLFGVFLVSCASPGPRPVPAFEPGPEKPFALRVPHAGRPAIEGRREDRDLLDQGMTLLRAGDMRRAQRLFREGNARLPKSEFRLGLAYVALLAGSWEEAEALLEPLLEGDAAFPAAIEAMADLDAKQGRWRAAFTYYRLAARFLPEDQRIAARLESAREVLAAGMNDGARDALERGDLEDARRIGLSLVDVAPAKPDGYQVLARTAVEGGKADDGWTWAAKAGSLGAAGRPWKEFVASLAMKTRRFAEARGIYTELAASDPSFEAKAEEAGLEFRIENLPESPRKAARSSKVTRGQVASLLWWAVPEVRDAVMPPSAVVAIDVVDHPDRQALARSIALGFLPVSRDTHKVRTDAPVSRSEVAGLLRKLGLLVAGGRELPRCLADVASDSQGRCGILPPSKSRTVSGKEALRAIERTTRLAREGEGQ